MPQAPHRRPTRSFVRPLGAVCASVWAALGVMLLAGCEATGNLKPGAEGIFDAFSGPSFEDAARMAIDPYNAESRYQGTMLLANAPFAGGEVYQKLFEDNIKDPDPGVRAAATRGLGLHGSPAQVPVIVERMSDADLGVRVEATRALQRLHNPAAIDPLIERLDPAKESEPDVRAGAAEALGQYAENRVVESLIATLDDDNLAMNRATRSSLRTLTGQDFGLDRPAWQAWYRDQQNAFGARAAYEYPVFSRDKRWFEYIPFVPLPPNEPRATPAGLLSEVGR